VVVVIAFDVVVVVVAIVVVDATPIAIIVGVIVGFVMRIELTVIMWVDSEQAHQTNQGPKITLVAMA
jgi:hypothetical protein